MISDKHMRIAFRTDASLQIGTGHVMRCLTLADALRDRGAECTFVCRSHPGHLLELIAQRQHKVHALPVNPADAENPSSQPAHAAWLGTDWATDARETCRALGDDAVDCLIVDHYALDSRWEQVLRPTCRRLMVIDDLADRSHDCDLLLDQNLGRTADDYLSLLPHGAATLIGPRYALLRPEFAQLRAESLIRRANPQLRHLLITMGGVDKDNATGRVLDVLKICSLPDEMRISVVMGPHAPWLPQVQAQAEQMPRPTQVLVGVSDMARLMADSDLAIGAAGGTSWERCCLGLPCLIIVLAENQKPGAAALQRIGAAYAMQDISDLSGFFQNDLLPSNSSKLFPKWILSASLVTDGKGVSRIIERLTSEYV